MKILNLNATLPTNGSGLWTTQESYGKRIDVRVTKLTVPYVNEENDFGELRVHFNTDDWNTDIHGLIYTDELFLHELLHLLVQNGFGCDVGYSEMGMQGHSYVSLDVGKDFLDSLNQVVTA